MYHSVTVLAVRFGPDDRVTLAPTETGLFKGELTQSRVTGAAEQWWTFEITNLPRLQREPQEI